MPDRLQAAEAAIRHLERTLRAIEQRLDAVERHLAAGGWDEAGAPGWDPGTRAADRRARSDQGVESTDVAAAASLVGGAILGVAGAFLLRALTDSAVLPQAAGVTLGFAYAASWLLVADRDGAAGRPAGAALHSAVAAIVAYPLMWEATLRFRLVGADGSAAALAVITGVVLAVAWRRRLRAVAWIAVSFALPAAVLLVATTDRILPYAVVLIAIGVATLWLGYVRHWAALRWPAALAADLAVVGVTVRVAVGHGVESAGAATAVQLLLVAAYLVSVIVRTLVRGRDVVPFEMAQAGATLAIGLGGAVAVVRETSDGTRLIGAGTLALAAACYVAAFVFLARRHGLGRNFYYYATLGLILALAGLPLVAGGTARGVVLGGAALASLWQGVRRGPAFLAVHAAVYALAASAASGVLAAAAYRLVAPAGVPWPPITPAMLAVITLVAAGLAVPTAPASDGRAARVARFVVLAITLGGATAIAVEALTMGSRGGMAAGALATVRTIVLAGAAIALAWTGRAGAFRESRWLVYPLLAAGGLKLVAEDFARSRPSTLFVALAAYGAALILAPRLTRRRPLT